QSRTAGINRIASVPRNGARRAGTIARFAAIARSTQAADLEFQRLPECFRPRTRRLELFVRRGGGTSHLNDRNGFAGFSGQARGRPLRRFFACFAAVARLIARHHAFQFPRRLSPAARYVRKNRNRTERVTSGSARKLALSRASSLARCWKRTEPPSRTPTRSMKVGSRPSARRMLAA